MIYITESQSSVLITHELAFEAVRRAYIAAAGSSAECFPVVHGHASDPQNRFTVKSGVDARLTGLKIGSYFATNDEAGLPRHNSITLLFDQTKGRIGAIVEGGRLNGYRTAAADAVATDALARADAKVLVVFGTGHQAEYEVLALSRIRSFTDVFVVGRDPARIHAFIQKLQKHGVSAKAADAETAVRSADIIVTATTAREPLFSADWVQPGTHISSMGSDAIGKQELPPALFAHASLFCDLPEQSARIGEFQHADPGVSLTAIGNVLADVAEGRKSPDDITIFDSSGISIQDLYVAELIITAAGYREDIL